MLDPRQIALPPLTHAPATLNATRYLSFELARRDRDICTPKHTPAGTSAQRLPPDAEALRRLVDSVPQREYPAREETR